jgi:phage head maturation protease
LNTIPASPVQSIPALSEIAVTSFPEYSQAKISIAHPLSSLIESKKNRG